MKAVVLAAGREIGMMPLTENVPKALIAVGKKPLLWNIITNLNLAGFDEVGVIVGFKREKVKDFVMHEKLKNVTLIEQPQQLGTAHAVSFAKDFVGNNNFLVVMGDNLYSPADLKELFKFNGPCVAATEVSNPERYGVIDHDNWVLRRIIEKPAGAGSSLINAGAYMLTPRVFDIIENLKGSGGKLRLPDAVNLLAQQEKVNVYRLNGFWFDLETIGDIIRAEGRLEGGFV